MIVYNLIIPIFSQWPSSLVVIVSANNILLLGIFNPVPQTTLDEEKDTLKLL